MKSNETLLYSSLLKRICSPYIFNWDVSLISHELKYIGKTYYEGFEIYQHLNKTIQCKLGFKVNKVEMICSNYYLIGVSFFLEETIDLIEDLKDTLAAYLNKEADLTGNTMLGSIGNIIYSWEDKDCVVGILSCTNDNGLFIHCIVNEFRFMW